MKKVLIDETLGQYRANLHCHTTISDGSKSPEEMKEFYKAHGYSAIAFTDHEAFLTHNDLTDDSFVALNGYELSVSDGWGPYSKCCHICFVALEPDNDLMEKITGGKLQELTMLQSDASVVDAVWRLMSAAHETVPSDFLRKNRMREVIYQILCGSCGRQLLQSIANFSQAAVHQQKPAAERGAELLF